MSNKEQIFSELVAIVGAGYVSRDKEDIIPYTKDAYSTVLHKEIPLPDFVVLPKTSAEVQNIVRLANKYKIPVYPRSFGTNIAGAALPYRGGIVIDLKRMDRILEINEETMTATIEPGVTWDRLRKRAREKNLDIIPIGGPYEVSPIGNFQLTNITPYSTKYCMDRAVTLEVVLPTGEILRTGSQCIEAGAKLNPYFRYAYGPDITGLFRGCMGNFGIITKMVIRLRPLAEIEKNLYFGFDNLAAALAAMKRIERLEITRTSQLCNKVAAIRFILHPEQFRLKAERERLKYQLPEYALTVGIGGNARQIALYEDMIGEVVQNEGGRTFVIDKSFIEAWDEVVEGCSQKVLRMFEPYGSFGTIVGCVPVSSVLGVVDAVSRIVAKYGLRDDIIAEPLVQEILIIPWDRCSTVYVEQEILYEPLDSEAVAKAMRCLRECYVELATKFGAVHTIPNQSLLRLMMPTYANLLIAIKEYLDPNGIMQVGGPYSLQRTV